MYGSFQNCLKPTVLLTRRLCPSRFVPASAYNANRDHSDFFDEWMPQQPQLESECDAAIDDATWQHFGKPLPDVNSRSNGRSWLPSFNSFCQRQWQYALQQPPSHYERFTVLSYNVLADYLAKEHHEKLYRHIPFNIIDWQSRKWQLFMELVYWCPDIMCLQEVDRFEDLEGFLKGKGYCGLYKRRTGNAIDGCSIFWKTERFKLLFEESIEYKAHGFRDNVAQIIVLEPILKDKAATGALHNESSTQKGENYLVVCNLHVYYNPRRGEVKLGQVRVLLDHAETISKEWHHAPVVIAGDFNAIPKSPLYEFLSKGKLDVSGITPDKISGQKIHQLNFHKYTVRRNSSTVSQFSKNILQSSVSCTDPLHSNDNAESIDKLQTHPVDKIHKMGEMAVQNLSSSEVLQNQRTDDSTAKIPLSEGISEEIGCSPNEHCKNKHSVNDMFLQSLNKETSLFTKKQLKTDLTLSNQILINEKETVLDVNANTIKIKNDSQNDIEPSVSDIIEILLRKHNSNVPLPATEGTCRSDSNTTFSTIMDKNVKAEDMDPSVWSEDKLEVATGNSECHVLQHNLKLKSAYSEVEDYAGTKDSCGEPLFTSYNKDFLGTVDYVWHTDDLQVVKVLDTLPWNDVKRTGGFPTPTWGSDHLALACQFALLLKS